MATPCIQAVEGFDARTPGSTVTASAAEEACVPAGAWLSVPWQYHDFSCGEAAELIKLFAVALFGSCGK